MKSHTGTTARGKRAEDEALAFLQRRGLTEVERNYRSRYGEIDLVMREGEVVVFIEVRARRSADYMDPVETLDARKLRRIILTGRHYLQDHPGFSGPCRFDVVTLTGGRSGAGIDWIRDAFADDAGAGG